MTCTERVFSSTCPSPSSPSSQTPDGSKTPRYARLSGIPDHDTPVSARQCPHWDGCSAPVCPLDGPGPTHLKGEPVCGLLRVLAKPEGEARLRKLLPCALVDTLVERRPQTVDTYPDIARQLKRAAADGST